MVTDPVPLVRTPYEPPPWIFDLLITTPGARTYTVPVMSLASMTVFAAVTVMSPPGERAVPAGTPVFDAPGRDGDPTGGGVVLGLADGVGVGDGPEVVVGCGVEVGLGVAVGVAVGLGDPVAPGGVEGPAVEVGLGAGLWLGPAVGLGVVVGVELVEVGDGEGTGRRRRWPDDGVQLATYSPSKEALALAEGLVTVSDTSMRDPVRLGLNTSVRRCQPGCTNVVRSRNETRRPAIVSRTPSVADAGWRSTRTQMRTLNREPRGVRRTAPR
jgi:hypothetical protein